MISPSCTPESSLQLPRSRTCFCASLPTPQACRLLACSVLRNPSYFSIPCNTTSVIFQRCITTPSTSSPAVEECHLPILVLRSSGLLFPAASHTKTLVIYNSKGKTSPQRALATRQTSGKRNGGAFSCSRHLHATRSESPKLLLFFPTQSRFGLVG